MVSGPVAPRDPAEKRAGFYVLLDKQVGGISQDDGRGRHPVYISSDRLPTFARVNGGIQDEEILALLTTAEGFRRLVHSVGVSLSAPAPMDVDFSLNFRGQGGPGSSHRFTLPADGAERVIDLTKRNSSLSSPTRRTPPRPPLFFTSIPASGCRSRIPTRRWILTPLPTGR